MILLNESIMLIYFLCNSSFAMMLDAYEIVASVPWVQTYMI